MTHPPFELVSESKFRIGERIVSGHFCDPPANGKWKYVIEANSDERHHIGQLLFVHDFSDVRPTDLPNGISIVIQGPKSDFGQVSFADIKKINDKSELTVVLNFDYVDWHLPLNLQHFVESFRDALIQQVDHANNCHIDHRDIGLSVDCSVGVDPDTNYFSAFKKVDAQVLATYRKCLSDIYKQQHVPKLEPITVSRPDEAASGARWWVRYVIVPVIGSGAVAALAAGLIALLK